MIKTSRWKPMTEVSVFATMSSTTKSSAAERPLIGQQLHWAIFLAPLFVSIGLALPSIGAFWFLRMFVQSFGQRSVPGVYWLCFLPAMIACLVLFFLAYLAYEDTQYILTTRRLAFSTGWLLRAKGEIQLHHIEAVFTVEPLSGQMLGYGTIIVVGVGGTRFSLHFVPQPHVFRHTLEAALEAVRSGVPLAPVPNDPVGVSYSLSCKSAPSGGSQANPFTVAPSTPFQKAWDELNKPQPNAEDDSRYQPKPRKS